jgi:3'-5' exoribonuclease
VKRIFVKDITKNTRIEDTFLVKEKHMGVTKNGAPYLSLRLMDRTGDINGRIWDDANQHDRLFEKNDFIVVSGRSSIYQGGMQLTISDLKKCNEHDVAMEDFLPAAPRAVEDMLKELMLVIQEIRDDYLKKLLKLIFEDEELVRLFTLSPAAKSLHHVYLGGLLEHSLSVARLVRMASDNYENVNRDLLVTGALLHDIGKVHELSYRHVFDYTDSGRLIGHISIGVEMVEEKIRSIEGFPSDLELLLKHMLLSHHGEYMYGSPRRPKTLEAFILSHVDDLDAKVNGFQQFVQKDNDSESKWSPYHRLFDRYLFKQSYNSTEATDEKSIHGEDAEHGEM